MGLLTPKTSVFHRIGNRYATLFDSGHFLGRSAFEDSWMTKPPTNVKNEKKAITHYACLPKG